MKKKTTSLFDPKAVGALLTELWCEQKVTYSGVPPSFPNDTDFKTFPNLDINDQLVFIAVCLLKMKSMIDTGTYQNTYDAQLRQLQSGGALRKLRKAKINVVQLIKSVNDPVEKKYLEHLLVSQIVTSCATPLTGQLIVNQSKYFAKHTLLSIYIGLRRTMKMLVTMAPKLFDFNRLIRVTLRDHSIMSFRVLLEHYRSRSVVLSCEVGSSVFPVRIIQSSKILFLQELILKIPEALTKKYNNNTLLELAIAENKIQCLKCFYYLRTTENQQNLEAQLTPALTSSVLATIPARSDLDDIIATLEQECTTALDQTFDSTRLYYTLITIHQLLQKIEKIAQQLEQHLPDIAAEVFDLHRFWSMRLAFVQGDYHEALKIAGTLSDKFEYAQQAQDLLYQCEDQCHAVYDELSAIAANDPAVMTFLQHNNEQDFQKFVFASPLFIRAVFNPHQTDLVNGMVSSFCYELFNQGKHSQSELIQRALRFVAPSMKAPVRKKIPDESVLAQSKCLTTLFKGLLILSNAMSDLDQAQNNKIGSMIVNVMHVVGIAQKNIDPAVAALQNCFTFLDLQPTFSSPREIASSLQGWMKRMLWVKRVGLLNDTAQFAATLSCDISKVEGYVTFLAAFDAITQHTDDNSLLLQLKSVLRRIPCAYEHYVNALFQSDTNARPVISAVLNNNFDPTSNSVQNKEKILKPTDDQVFMDSFRSWLNDTVSAFENLTDNYNQLLVNIRAMGKFTDVHKQNIGSITASAYLKHAFLKHRFRRAQLIDYDFSQAILDQVDFRSTTFVNCSFKECTLIDVNFDGAMFENTIIIDQLNLANATQWTLQSFLIALGRSKKNGCTIIGSVAPTDYKPDFDGQHQLIDQALSSHQQQVVSGYNHVLAELHSELSKTKFHLVRTAKAQTQRHDLLSCRILMLEQNITEHSQYLQRFLAWQAEHERYYHHDNIKIQLYYRKLVSHVCSILQAIFLSQSELIELNHQQVLRSDRKVDKSKGLSPSSFHNLSQATSIVEKVFEGIHVASAALPAISNFLASMLKVTAKVTHFLPIVGTVAGIVSELAEKAVKAAAENAMEHAADQLMGMTPLMLERLSVELAIRMTKKYSPHLQLLKANHHGVIRFAECGAIRILVCILGNTQLHQYDPKSDMIDQLIKFVESTTVAQNKKLWKPVKFIRADYDILFIKKHQMLEVDPSSGVKEQLDENTLHQSKPEDLPQSITQIAEGAAQPSSTQQQCVEDAQKDYINQLESKSVADDETIKTLINTVNRLVRKTDQLESQVNLNCTRSNRNYNNHVLLTRSLAKTFATDKPSGVTPPTHPVTPTPSSKSLTSTLK